MQTVENPQKQSTHPSAHTAEKQEKHVQSLIQYPVPEQGIIAKRNFPIEFSTVNQKAFQRFLAMLDGYNTSNDKMFVAGTVAQKAFGFFSPDFVDVNQTGIDFIGRISNESYQFKLTRVFDFSNGATTFKQIKIKNERGNGSDDLIFADYYICVEQSTGRGACVSKDRLSNIRHSKADVYADIVFRKDDFWMPAYNCKSILDEDGEIEYSDLFWKNNEKFCISQFELCL